MSTPIKSNVHDFIEVRRALQVLEKNRRSAPLNNFTATAAWTVDDDSSRGYSVGSYWFNTTTKILYVCTDATNGAAVWYALLSPPGGGGIASYGDASGPVSSTDSAVVLFDGTDGKTLKGSVVTIDSSGNVTTAGNVDGRDVSVDGTKLDTIETSADVTDAANVAAAGAVMDTDITSNGIVVRTASGTYTSRSVAAGQGMSVTNGDGVSGNPSVALADKSRTFTRIVYITSPTSSDVVPVFLTADAITITRVRSQTATASSTVDFNLQHRGTTTPFTTTTTKLWTADEQATSTGENNTTFNDATVAADSWLTYVASATSGSPTAVIIGIEYTVD